MVQDLQLTEILAIQYLACGFIRNLGCFPGCKHEHELCSKVRSDNGLMGLVVKQLPLLFRVVLVCKLPSACCISGGNQSSSMDPLEASTDDANSGADHCHVERSLVSFHLKLSVPRNCGKPAEHVVPWYSHLVEAQIPIVHGVVAHLCTNVTNIDAWQWRVVIQTSDGNNERMDTP